MMAAFAVLVAGDILGGQLREALAFHADTGLSAAAGGVSAANVTRLVGSAVLFVVGLGLSLYASLHGRRIR
jgi:hypothetical protein